jgi:hypothetical protein
MNDELDNLKSETISKIKDHLFKMHQVNNYLK